MSFQQDEKSLIRSHVRHNRDNGGGNRILLFIFLPFICILAYTTLVGALNSLVMFLWLLAVVCLVIYTVYRNMRSKREANEWLEAHGREVIVTVTDKIIDPSQKDGENNFAHMFQLTWIDPSSGASRSLWEKVDALRYERYRIGAKLMMAYDTDEPSFHEVRWYR